MSYLFVKNILSVVQIRNHVTKAVERAVPFGLLRHSLLIIWYTLHRQPSTDTAHAPWCQTKTRPSTQDMLTTLRRQIITVRSSSQCRGQWCIADIFGSSPQFGPTPAP